MNRILYIIIGILILLQTQSVQAQKKEISQIKTYLKSGKDFDKAETLARNVVKMEGQQDNVEAFYLLAESVRKQYEATNEKLYLKTLTDTASVFPLTRRMFAAYETLDSVDMMPDKKGVVKLKYRKKNSEYLNRLRPNLYNGGLFFMKKHNYQEAFKCMDTYLQCEQEPLFADYDYATSDSLRSEAAFVALTSARRMKDNALVVRYADIALQNKTKAHYALAELHQTAMEMADTLKAVDYLKQGFDRYPEFNYYFPRLIDYYVSRNELDTVETFVNRALEIEPGNLFYRMAKNIVQLNLGQYRECIALGDSLIHANDKMANAYYNVGSAYFNMAIGYDAKGKSAKQKRKEVNELYEKARPYIEKYRQMRPRRKDQWAQMLYTIYLNLNMGPQFEEIDDLIKVKQ